MYSRCSHCQSQIEISAEQLRRSRGLLKCSSCGKRFDALISLSEQADEDIHRRNLADLLPNLADKPSAPAAWGIGSVFLGLVFIAQVVYFQSDTLSRLPMVRIGWQTICGQLHCRVPEYKNLDEWAVSHSDFQIRPDQGYVFSAAITNQAAFSQNFPDLKLELRNLGGQVVAERIFSGRQYASGDALTANGTAEIRLNVVVPPNIGEIGGYTFALI